MKRLFRISITLLVFAGGGFAQKVETFDLATFTPPAGWKKEVGENGVQLSTEDNDDYCLITLYKAIPALADAEENFKASWDTIVKEAVTVNASAQMIPAANKEDWKALGGFSPFEKEGMKGVAVLVNISGHGKMVNVFVLTNTQKFEPKITAFLESISLKTPEAEPVQTTAPAGGDVSAIVGSWGMSSSDQSAFAMSHGTSGYIKRQYDFNSNGTYVFMVKTFTYTSSELLFTKETGTYKLTGNSLTITPQKGYIQGWTKGTVVGGDGRTSQTDKWGKLVKTQPTKLETVTYQISKEYFSGIDEWQLVMRTSVPTQREGPFVSNSAFPNSYFYKTQKFPIEPPQ